MYILIKATVKLSYMYEMSWTNWGGAGGCRRCFVLRWPFLVPVIQTAHLPPASQYMCRLL